MYVCAAIYSDDSEAEGASHVETEQERPKQSESVEVLNASADGYDTRSEVDGSQDEENLLKRNGNICKQCMYMFTGCMYLS